jgi:hypothetical protein
MFALRHWLLSAARKAIEDTLKKDPEQVKRSLVRFVEAIPAEAIRETLDTVRQALLVQDVVPPPSKKKQKGPPPSSLN